MSEPLDPLDFKKSRYERPQQDWICGRGAEGHACPLGPDQRGQCRATGECVPARKGDRWSCTRIEANGGKCADGPLPDGRCCHPIPPCQPVRSLRAKRGRYAWLVLAFTLGALLFAVANPWLRKKSMNPGPLIAAHATSATQCSDCHTFEGTRAAITPGGVLHTRGLADSQRCIKCHGLGPQPLDAHGAAPAALAAITADMKKEKEHPSAPLLLKISGLLAGHAQTTQLACATCHQEHHGRTFDITHLSDTQCQTCHSVQFASFDRGHPDFGAYPYRRRTRIFFDHASHLGTHFVDDKAQAPASCESCHTPDSSGRLMLVKGFEQTCAACHSAQIKGEGMTTKGIAFFTVPGLDTDTLNAKGSRFGTWPKFADGKLTPFMVMLLDANPSAKAALATLQGTDLLDLSKATPAQLQAATQLAWAVKGLLYDLEMKGQAMLVQQLETEMNTITPRTASDLTGEISRAAVIAAQKNWFPDLLTEVANHRRGIEPPAVKVKTVTAAPPAKPAPAPAASGDSSLLAGGGDDSLVGSAKSTPAAAKNDDLTSGGDLLATPAKTTAPAARNDDLTSGGDLLSGATPAAAPAATPPPSAPAAPVAMDAEDWMADGGWYQPADGYSLLYRPTGHADAFLTAWLDASAAQASTPQGRAAALPVFQTLSDPDAPGLCMKCHTVDNRAGTLTVNWTAARPAPNDHPFTKFNHSAHFSLLTGTGCETCHQLNPKSDYATHFVNGTDGLPVPSPAPFQSNFAPLSKSICVKCHTPRIAGDNCLECHNYHTGTFAAKMGTPLSQFMTAPAGAAPAH